MTQPHRALAACCTRRAALGAMSAWACWTASSAARAWGQEAAPKDDAPKADPPKTKDVPPAAESAEDAALLRRIAGMGGYCPVSLHAQKQWVKGDPQHVVTFDSQTYLTASAEAADEFRENPSKFVPVLNGDSAVQWVNGKRRVPGNVSYAQLHKGRLFLFVSTEERDVFQKAPERFEESDLALDGFCVVSKVDANRDVLGRYQYSVRHDGLRYRFAGSGEQKSFLASVSKYAVRPTYREPSTRR